MIISRSKILSFSLLFGLSIALSSCISIKNYQAEMLFPASMSMPYEGNTIGFVSRIELLSDLPTYTLNTRTIDSLLNNEIMVGASEVVAYGPKFTFLDINLNQSGKLSSRNISSSRVFDYLDVLMPDSMDILCYLETLQMEYKLLKDTLLNIPEELRGSILSSSRWRIFDLQNHQFQHYSFTDTMTIVSNVMYSENIENPYHPDFQNSFIRAANEHGKSFGQIISPFWSDVDRVYYDSYLIFRGARKFIHNGNWKEAEEIWNKYTLSSDDFIASCACFNMAVAAEMAGEIEKAILWLDKSEDEGLSEMVEQYRKILLHRESMIQYLDSQLGEI